MISHLLFLFLNFIDFHSHPRRQSGCLVLFSFKSILAYLKTMHIYLEISSLYSILFLFSHFFSVLFYIRCPCWLGPGVDQVIDTFYFVCSVTQYQYAITAMGDISSTSQAK